MTRVSSKNQITLPVGVLRATGLRSGDEVDVRPQGAGAIIVAMRGGRIRAHAGIADGIYRDNELNELRGEWER